MKSLIKSLAICIALTGMAHASDEPATQDGRDGTLVVANFCEAAPQSEGTRPDRFSKATKLARLECAKPDWSWED